MSIYLEKRKKTENKDEIRVDMQTDRQTDRQTITNSGCSADGIKTAAVHQHVPVCFSMSQCMLKYNKEILKQTETNFFICVVGGGLTEEEAILFLHTKTLL